MSYRPDRPKLPGDSPQNFLNLTSPIFTSFEPVIYNVLVCLRLKDLEKQLEKLAFVFRCQGMFMFGLRAHHGPNLAPPKEMG